MRASNHPTCSTLLIIICQNDTPNTILKDDMELGPLTQNSSWCGGGGPRLRKKTTSGIPWHLLNAVPIQRGLSLEVCFLNATARNRNAGGEGARGFRVSQVAARSSRSTPLRDLSSTLPPLPKTHKTLPTPPPCVQLNLRSIDRTKPTAKEKPALLCQ